jgi:ABC-type amino acid transport substrate-binding protein
MNGIRAHSIPIATSIALLAIASLDARQLTSSSSSPGGSLPLDVVTRPWTGDFDGMVQRRRVRVLTPYSRTHYFIDKGVPRGIVFDFGMKVEQEMNRLLKTTPATRVHVVFVPTARDQLYQSLIEGRGDIAASNLAVTSERGEQVAFTTPGQTNVKQIVVTGPGSRAIGSLGDLAAAGPEHRLGRSPGQPETARGVESDRGSQQGRDALR